MAHQIDESKPKYLSQTRFMSGRRIIKTSVTEITDENVVDVLRKALATHELNRSEIDYLWKYYRGDQPIRNRVKDVRPEICNKITENRANEIVSFKVGYLCGEPIQYVSRNGGEEIVKQINTLAEDLKYVEAFARAGYIGTVGGVNIYTKKDATKGTIVVATRQAVTIFNKKGVEVETDRDGDIRQNTIWSRKYYLAALTDATKAVKIFKGTATATADTTVSEGKVYYAKTDNGYIVGKPKTNPKTEGFYEIA